MSFLAAADDRADDLRALAARTPRVHRARARRPGAAARRAAAGEPAPRRAAAPARGRRARDRPPLQPPVEAQLRSRHGLLSARLVHDEAQPEAARARRGAARTREAPSAPGPAPRAGSARADVAPAGRARRGLGPAARVAAPLRRLARRARGRAAHARASRGPRRAANEGADSRQRPRHQSRHGDDGRLRAGQGRRRRAWQCRSRRSASQGRRPGRLPDADQPLDARVVRSTGSRRSSGSCTASARRCTTTAPT